MRDKTLRCESCGTTFLYTVSQQRAHAKAPAAERPRCCPGCLALERLTIRRRGTIRWYDARKGYGFIRDEDGREVFVHATALGDGPAAVASVDSSAAVGRARRPGPAAPRPGQPVEYDLEETDRGCTARDVSLIREEGGRSEPAPR